jgi:hypothetical protein
MLNYADTVGIGENGTTSTLRFLVNPSTAWIPNTDDGGIDKCYLNSVDRTRAPGYVLTSTDFRITKIEPSPKGKGEYIATIAALDGGSGHATLVLDVASANDTEPVLISSSVFHISGSGDTPQVVDPVPGPDLGRLFHIEDNDRSQYALADETRTNVGQFLFRSSVAWSAEVVGGAGTRLGLESPTVSWLHLMVDGEEKYSGPAGDMPVFIELDRNDTDYMREATVIFSPETGDESIHVRVRQEAGYSETTRSKIQ